MNKYPLIGGSILAVVLLILGSMNNIVGYQTVQASNQKIITTKENLKELLFQTIVNLVNNKKIQRVVLGSEITGKWCYNSEMRFSVFTPPILTVKLLKHLNTMGMILFGTPSKSKIQSFIKQHQLSNQAMKKEISLIIEKDATLKDEMTRLSTLKCDCENDRTMNWSFPIICIILLPFFIIISFLTDLFPDMWPYQFIIWALGDTLHCFWTPS